MPMKPVKKKPQTPGQAHGGQMPWQVMEIPGINSDSTLSIPLLRFYYYYYYY